MAKGTPEEQPEEGVSFMFMGEYNHTIDTKGRLIIPSKFRDLLGEEFIATKGFVLETYGRYEKIFFFEHNILLLFWVVNVFYLEIG